MRQDDFEVHSIGTANEIRLSRELCNQIKQCVSQWGVGIIPHNVFHAYQNLMDHHDKFLEKDQ